MVENIPVDESMVEGCVAKLVPGMNRGTMLQQELDNLHVSLSTSHMKGCVPSIVHLIQVTSLHSTNVCVRVCVYMCVCTCVCARVCVHVCVCMYVW